MNYCSECQNDLPEDNTEMNGDPKGPICDICVWEQKTGRSHPSRRKKKNVQTGMTVERASELVKQLRVSGDSEGAIDLWHHFHEYFNTTDRKRSRMFQRMCGFMT